MPRDRRVTDAVKQLATYFGAVTDAAFIDQSWDFNSRFTGSRGALAGGGSGALPTASSLTEGLTYTTGTPISEHIANLINGSASIHSFMQKISDAGGFGKYQDQIRIYAPAQGYDPNVNGTKLDFQELDGQSYTTLVRSSPNSDLSNGSHPNTNFYAAVISNPFMGPMVKDTGAVEIFMNGIPTLEFSKCVPYINIELISTRRTLGTTAPALTLSGFLNPSELGSADSAILGAGNISNVRSEATDLGPGIRSGIELFTSPQTLVNMTGPLGPEFVPVIDRLRPLASLGNLSLSTKLQGGTLSFTSGRLEITIHDRSRLRDMAAFVRPDLYGTTFLDITHGWSHPDNSLVTVAGSPNAFGQFLDALKMKTRYRISNSSFSFEEGGQIKVTLSIQTVGSIDLLYLGPGGGGANNTLAELKKSMELINERLTTLKARAGGSNPAMAQYDFMGALSNPESAFTAAASKEFLKSLAEFLKKGNGDQEIINLLIETFGKVTSKSTSATGDIKKAQDELKASYKSIIDGKLEKFDADEFAKPLLEENPDRFKLLGTNVVIATDSNGAQLEGVKAPRPAASRPKPVAQPAPVPSAPTSPPPDFASAAAAAAEKAAEDLTRDIAAAADAKVAAATAASATVADTTPATVADTSPATVADAAPTTTPAAESSPAPASKTSKVGGTHTSNGGGSGIKPSDFYTLGSIFMKMVAEPIKESGQYDEVQVIFYPFNRFAGAVHDLPVSCFPVEGARFTKAIEQAVTKVPELSGRALIQLLNNRFVNFAPSRAYLMTDFYDLKEAEDGKSTLVEGQTQSFKKPSGGTVNLKVNPALTLEERLLRADIPEKKLQLPRIEVAVEGCPLLDADGQPVPGENGQAKTLIKIHVYDATIDPHRTLSEIITAAKDNELGLIQVPTAEYNKASKKADNKKAQDETASIALEAVRVGLDNGVLEGITKETLESISTTDANVLSIIEGIKGGTTFVRIKGSYEEIKRVVSAGMPTIIYGGSTSAITNASLTTGGSAGMSTVMMMRAFNSPGETATENIESGVPMQILPAQLSMSTIGCPLFSPMQRFFVDFGTGTSLDSCYYVVSVDSTIGSDGYKTDLKMAYSAGFPAYQSLNTQLAALAANFAAATGVKPTVVPNVKSNEEKPQPKPDVETEVNRRRQQAISAAVSFNRVKREQEARLKRALDKQKTRIERAAAQKLAKLQASLEAAIPERQRIFAKRAEAEKAKAEVAVAEKQAEVSKLVTVTAEVTVAAQLINDLPPDEAERLTAEVAAVALA